MLLLMAAAIAPAARAATDFTMNWSGFGTIDSTFTSGDDATARMQVWGNTAGTFGAQDTGIAPYSYGVDDSSAYMRGDITANGELAFTYDRTDSYESMYGAAGQHSYSFVGSSGTGSLDFRAGSNYAAFGSGNYAWQSDAQFTAAGDFNILHTLTTPNLNGGVVQVVGSGSATINHMSDDAGANSFNFGAGAGCYTNADISTSGIGTAWVSGHGDSLLHANDGSWNMPGGTYTSTWSYGNGLSVTNYAFNGN